MTHFLASLGLIFLVLAMIFEDQLETWVFLIIAMIWFAAAFVVIAIERTKKETTPSKRNKPAYQITDTVLGWALLVLGLLAVALRVWVGDPE